VLEGADWQPQLQEALGRIAQLEATLATTCTTLAQVTAERDKLRRAYEQLQEQLELLRRRIYIAKAERIDARQLEIEFEQTHRKLQALARELGDDASPPPAPPPATKPRPKPTGRRDLKTLELPEERVELLNPALEGKVERIGFEESCRVGYRRGGPVRWVVARATYKNEPSSEPGQDGKPVIVTVPKPKELVERGILAPSMIAHILCQKYRWGMPFHRLAKKFSCDGFPLDDAMMGRYAEHVGASLGCIVEACAKEAKEMAFCLSTDATGVCVQPEPAPGRQRQACRKGHLCPAAHNQKSIAGARARRFAGIGVSRGSAIDLWTEPMRGSGGTRSVGLWGSWPSLAHVTASPTVWAQGLGDARGGRRRSRRADAGAPLAVGGSVRA
jgi:transposase